MVVIRLRVLDYIINLFYPMLFAEIVPLVHPLLLDNAYLTHNAITLYIREYSAVNASSLLN